MMRFRTKMTVPLGWLGGCDDVKDNVPGFRLGDIVKNRNCLLFLVKNIVIDVNECFLRISLISARIEPIDRRFCFIFIFMRFCIDVYDFERWPADAGAPLCL